MHIHNPRSGFHFSSSTPEPGNLGVGLIARTALKFGSEQKTVSTLVAVKQYVLNVLTQLIFSGDSTGSDFKDSLIGTLAEDTLKAWLLVHPEEVRHIVTNADDDLMPSAARNIG